MNEKYLAYDGSPYIYLPWSQPGPRIIKVKINRETPKKFEVTSRCGDKTLIAKNYDSRLFKSELHSSWHALHNSFAEAQDAIIERLQGEMQRVELHKERLDKTKSKIAEELSRLESITEPDNVDE